MGVLKKGIIPQLTFIFSLLVILYAAVYLLIYKPTNTPYSTFQTSPILSKDEVYKGYTLISPYNRILKLEEGWRGHVYLLDLFARPVHTWSTKFQPLYSMLIKNGNLLSVMELPKYSQVFPPGGNTGTIQELDFDSNVVWEYKDESMHHDIDVLPNGNIAVALWEETPDDIALQIRGGAEGSNLPSGITWSDRIVEINRDKEVVWSWHSYEHMDPQEDILGTLMPRFAWTFTNGLKYLAKNPIDGEEAYLLSMRSINTIMIVRKKDGEIIWRSPKGMFSAQHDPTLLPSGNILAFDNGLDRIPNPFPMYGSRVIEVDPKTDKIVWQYDGGPVVIDKVRFFALIVSGAQRLPNGNTLITDGPKGHVFEVTNKGKVVWDMVSPYTTIKTGEFPNNFLFKTRRYGEKEINLKGKIAPAFNESEYSLQQLLKNIYP